MPKDLKLHIIHANDFIRTTDSGEVDLDQSKNTLANIARTAANMEEYHILIDTRQATTQMTMADIWELANHLGKFGKVFYNKTAILVRDLKAAHRAQFFELCARNRGFRVNVFDDFEKAIDWLTTSTEQEVYKTTG